MDGVAQERTREEWVEFWSEQLWHRLRALASLSFASHFAGRPHDAAPLEEGLTPALEQQARAIRVLVTRVREHEVPWHRVARFVGEVELACNRALYGAPERFGEQPPEQGGDLRAEWTPAERAHYMEILVPLPPIRGIFCPPKNRRKGKGRKK